MPYRSNISSCILVFFYWVALKGNHSFQEHHQLIFRTTDPYIASYLVSPPLLWVPVIGNPCIPWVSIVPFVCLCQGKIQVAQHKVYTPATWIPMFSHVYYTLSHNYIIHQSFPTCWEPWLWRYRGHKHTLFNANKNQNQSRKCHVGWLQLQLIKEQIPCCVGGNVQYRANVMCSFLKFSSVLLQY